VNIANLLPNGVLTANSVVTDGTGANNTFFNINGGILRAGRTDTGFMTGVGAVTVFGGGATIDTAGFDITIAQVLLDGGGGGGLTKLGEGNLIFARTNTFTGPVTVNAGSLTITNVSSLGAGTNIILNGGFLVATNLPSPFVMASGSVLSGTNGTFLVTNLFLSAGAVISPGGPGGIGTLTIGSSTNDIVTVNGICEMDFSPVLPVACDRIAAAGNLDLSGMTISFPNWSTYKEGVDYVIATYGNSVTMPAALVTIPASQSSIWKLSHDADNKRVILKRLFNGTVMTVR
jgi:autotransporter-associated beta strand protein